DQVARAFAEYAKNRWGGLDKIKEALYHDPVGMLSDFWTVVAGAGGLAKAASKLGALAKTGEAAGAVADVARLTPKRAVAAVEAPPSPEAVQEAIRQKAYDLAKQRSGEGIVPGYEEWRQAEQDIRRAPQRPAPGSEAAPRPNPISKGITNTLTGAGLGYAAAELLAHHLMGALGSGVAVGAIKYLPKLLASDAGQQMLAKIGPGSKPAAIAALARDIAPALNTLYRTEQQQTSQTPIQVRGWATGGVMNPELARIQRERLRLPGILEMLDKRK